ncbi:MAG: ABC transporter permease [Candidatus Pacearchaeota archaeon]|jgi:putative ABC transport system permease protein
MIKDYFILALRNLQKRGLRSWLTMLGIFISIATIFVLISLSVGLQDSIQEQFRLLGTDKFFITPLGQAGAPGSGGAVQLTLKDFDVAEKVAGVKEATYATIGNGKIEFADQARYYMVIGIPLDKTALFEEIGSYKADEGRMLIKGDVGKVMLGSNFKYGNVFKKPVGAGDKIVINGKTFIVEGILVSVGNPSDDANIIISGDDFKELFNSGDRVDQIMVQVDAGENVTDIADKVEKRLINSRGVTKKTEDFSISTPEELLQSFQSILSIITIFLIGVAAISLVVGAIGIMNTMYTSVIERTREIGIMKAIGAQNKDILFIFLIESGLLGLVGGAIGVGLGFGLSKIVEVIIAQALGTGLLKAAAPLYLIFGLLGFSFLIGAGSGLFPAWRASKINVVDALRYE